MNYNRSLHFVGMNVYICSFPRCQKLYYGYSTIIKFSKIKYLITTPWKKDFWKSRHLVIITCDQRTVPNHRKTIKIPRYYCFCLFNFIPKYTKFFNHFTILRTHIDICYKLYSWLHQFHSCNPALRYTSIFLVYNCHHHNLFPC